ncbi:MAG TPA: CARDB domain-containing protein, partial [Patescibacteria group bacterium]|nr:CARDB domain-containing protein [Patescibacteria group bacterium]
MASLRQLQGYAQALPDLVPVIIQWSDPLLGAPNPRVTLVWGTTNQGTGTTSGEWIDSVWIASNGVPSSAASSVDSEATYVRLGPGESIWRTNLVRLPIVSSGSYSLFFKADADDFVTESVENNNELAIPLQFQATPPDLMPIAVQVPTFFTGPPNPSITIVWGITNRGAAEASGGWSDMLYLSTDPTWDPQDLYITSSYEEGPISPEGSYWRTNQLRLPITQSGNYYLILFADQWNSLYENQTNNNQISAPISVQIRPPDLVPLALLAPATLTTPPKPTVTIVWGVTNQGPGAAIGYDSWQDMLYLSTNAALDSTATYLLMSPEAGPVDANGVYWRTNQLQLPVVQSGTYYLIFSANSFGQLLELNKDNNTISIPITLAIQPPDLAVDTSQIPAAITAPPNPWLTFIWGVTNQGIGAALGTWYDQMGISTNTNLSWWDVSMWNYVTDALAPGDTVWHTNTLQVPATQSGKYNLIFTADPNSTLFESQKSNNIGVVPVQLTIQPSDLMPVDLKVPTVVTSTPRPTVSLTWAVTNQGPGYVPTNAFLADAIYLSTNGLPDGSAMQVWTGYTNGPVLSGTKYPWQANLTLPIVQSGTFYLMFVVDLFGGIFEANETNNVVAVPIRFEILQPDLRPVAFQAPANVTAPPNPLVNLSWAVTNVGAGPALGNWSDTVYLSTDSVLDS